MVRKSLACCNPLKSHSRLIFKGLRNPSAALLEKHEGLLEKSSWLCSQCRRALGSFSQAKSQTDEQMPQSPPPIPSGSVSSQTCPFVPAYLKERNQDATKERMRKTINRLRVRLCRNQRRLKEAKEDMKNVCLSSEDIIQQLAKYFYGQKLTFLS